MRAQIDFLTDFVAIHFPISQQGQYDQWISCSFEIGRKRMSGIFLHTSHRELNYTTISTKINI